MDLSKTMKSGIGGVVGNKQNEIMPIIMELIGGQSGGLGELVQKFTDKGHGDIVSSWIGTGKKLPVSPDQVQDVLGTDTVNNMASKLGTDTNAVTGQLSTLLPEVVNKLTPDGKIPEGDILSKGKDLLGGLTGKL